MSDQRSFFDQPPTDTLSMARARFRSALHDGERVDCPCCDRDGHIDHRKLNTAMAIGLAFFYHQRKNKHGGFAHVEDQPPMCKKNRETSRLKHWGMIEQKYHKPDEKKRTSGVWRITATGIEFIEGRSHVPRTKHVFDDVVIWQSDELTSFAQALGDAFDYLEVLRGVLPWSDDDD